MVHDCFPLNLDLPYGIEWAILEGIVLDPVNEERRVEIDALLEREEVHLGELLEQSSRHRLLPRLAAWVGNAKWLRVVPFTIFTDLQLTLWRNQHRISIYRGEAAAVFRALDAEGIRFACTKGLAFESTLYRGDGTRMMNDVDIMILPSDREKVGSVLRALGLENSTYSWTERRVIPLDRRAQIDYQLNPDHLPHFLRPLSDPACPFVSIDVANSLTWHGSPWCCPVELVLEDCVRQPIPGIEDVRLPSLSWPFSFLFTILHLFREAWLERNFKNGTDVTLAQFADVYLCWRDHHDDILRGEFMRAVRAHDLTKPVGWVLAHLDRLFGTDAAQALGLDGGMDDVWLGSALGADGPLRWHGNMRARLHEKKKIGLFVRNETGPLTW